MRKKRENLLTSAELYLKSKAGLWFSRTPPPPVQPFFQVTSKYPILSCAVTSPPANYPHLPQPLALTFPSKRQIGSSAGGSITTAQPTSCGCLSTVVNLCSWTYVRRSVICSFWRPDLTRSNSCCLRSSEPIASSSIQLTNSPILQTESVGLKKRGNLQAWQFLCLSKVIALAFSFKPFFPALLSIHLSLDRKQRIMITWKREHQFRLHHRRGLWTEYRAGTPVQQPNQQPCSQQFYCWKDKKI